jgi:hypothetical protein
MGGVTAVAAVEGGCKGRRGSEHCTAQQHNTTHDNLKKDLSSSSSSSLIISLLFFVSHFSFPSLLISE